MLPILQIGPLSVQTSGLVLLIGLWIGLGLSERYAKGFGSDPEEMSNLAFYSLLGAIVGARLSYAVRFPNAFTESPASLISLNPGLLDPWGAVVSALLIGLIYGQRKELSFWQTLDSLTPGFATLAIAAAISQLASGEAYGLSTDLPWAIDLWGAMRHPSQIYATLAAAAILYYMLTQRTGRKLPPGNFFIEFIALSAGSRLFLEAFRGDSALLPNGWRIVQLLAWLGLAASLYWLNRPKKAKT
jgi:phosphatidylglycerol:prolipoprotein diacylglycerol transferase